MGEELHVETGADGVCRITLDRPDAKHALTVAMRDGIVDALRAGRSDPAVRAFLLRATGDAFCAGMDLGASTVSQAGKPGFDPRTTARRCASACRPSSASSGRWTSPPWPRCTAPPSAPAPTSRS